MKKAKREEIKKDLMNQMEMSGNTEKYFLDLIDDYMSLWDTKTKLVADIEERGVKVKNTSNSGVVNYKKNESIDLLIKTNAQMLKMLNELGIKASKVEVEFDDEL